MYGVVVGDGEALGVGQGFLEFGGEFVESHGEYSVTAQLRLLPGLFKAEL